MRAGLVITLIFSGIAGLIPATWFVKSMWDLQWVWNEGRDAHVILALATIENTHWNQTPTFARNNSIFEGSFIVTCSLAITTNGCSSFGAGG